MPQQFGEDPEGRDPKPRLPDGLPGTTPASEATPTLKETPTQSSAGFAGIDAGSNPNRHTPVGMSPPLFVDAVKPVDKGHSQPNNKRKYSWRQSIEWLLLTYAQVVTVLFLIIYPVFVINTLQQLEAIRQTQRTFDVFGRQVRPMPAPPRIAEVTGWIILDAVARELIAAALFVVFSRCKQWTDPKSIPLGSSSSTGGPASESTKLVLPFEP